MKQVTKKLCVVAYDIADSKRRARIIKAIEKYGTRINYSVFECMFTDAQMAKVLERVGMIIKPPEDNVIFYPLCADCFSKAIYLPERKLKSKIIAVI